LAVGCWLLAVGCWLLAVGCWLLAELQNFSNEKQKKISQNVKNKSCSKANS
jgi:high-affinity Fe2+/Pb2+ permease